jgi:hypothetical protein
VGEEFNVSHMTIWRVLHEQLRYPYHLEQALGLMPVDVIHSRHQQQFSINTCAGIVGDYLVGPCIFPHQLTVNHYQDLFLHELQKLLEDVSLVVRTWMWYMHDGIPAHFCHAVRDVLKDTHNGRWIYRGGPAVLPPCLSDLNHLEFYLRGHLKLVRSPCWQRRFTSPSYCGCFSDYLQLLWHLWIYAVVHDETCWDIHGISWRTFWALTIDVLIQS